VWQQKWTKVLEWKDPFAKWFVGAKLNVSENCLDRHLGTPRQNKAAILWEGEPGEKRVLTYQQLHREVCRFANVLKAHKVKKGERVIRENAVIKVKKVIKEIKVKKEIKEIEVKKVYKVVKVTKEIKELKEIKGTLVKLDAED
jgi:hypothetical protein